MCFCPDLSASNKRNNLPIVRTGEYRVKTDCRARYAGVFKYFGINREVSNTLHSGSVTAAIFPAITGQKLCCNMNLPGIRRLKGFGIDEKRCIASLNRNSLITKSVDRVMSIIQERDLYHEVYSGWFNSHVKTPEERLFMAILILLAVFALLFFVSSIFVYTLRRLVRRRTHELAVSEARYRSLVQNIPQSIFIKNRKSVYVTCNDNFALDNNVQSGDVAGKTDYDYYPRLLADKYREDDARIMLSGITEEIEEPYIKRGEKRWVCTVKSPVRDEEGTITGILGIVWDITEQKMKDDELRESERRLSMAERVANVGSWEFDAQSRQMVWSKQLFHILDLDTETAAPSLERGLDVLHPDDRSTFLNSIRNIMNGNNPVFTQARIVRYNGDIKWVEVRGETVCDASGNIAKLVGSVLDITDLKRSEEKIHDSLGEKESLIRELYHRTKNNMQVICSMLSSRSRSFEDESMRVVFNDMKNRIYSMALVHQKLYSSKNLSRINLREYVVELVGNVIRSYEFPRRKISTHFEMEEVFVNIDTAIPFGVALHEFIANTCKYAFEGRVSGDISVTLRKGDELIEFGLSDNGIGMEVKDGMPVISRMGLQTAYALICDQLHGGITIHSENGLHYLIRFCDHEKKRKY
jgi:PAS domain S-box-containing protein